MSKPAVTQPAVYYVSYSYPLGFGGMDITVSRPIRTADDFWHLISNEVQQEHPKAVVLSYQLINQPDPVDTATIAGLVSAAQHDLAAGTPPKTILTNLLAELYKISR